MIFLMIEGSSDEGQELNTLPPYLTEIPINNPRQAPQTVEA